MVSGFTSMSTETMTALQDPILHLVIIPLNPVQFQRLDLSTRCPEMCTVGHLRILVRLCEVVEAAVL